MAVAVAGLFLACAAKISIFPAGPESKKVVSVNGKFCIVLPSITFFYNAAIIPSFEKGGLGRICHKIILIYKSPSIPLFQRGKLIVKLFLHHFSQKHTCIRCFMLGYFFRR